MLRTHAIALALAVMLASPVLAQQQVVERLGVPGPITFESTEFHLAWSAQPTATYYKQEYLPEGAVFESYPEMFFIDALTEPVTPARLVADMMASLDQRKASDPVVNYEVARNDASGEIVLDFLVSDLSVTPPVVEWNAYRYVPLGQGVALYAISRRGYGEDGIDTFLNALKDWRPATIEALATYQLPAIAVAQ